MPVSLPLTTLITLRNAETGVIKSSSTGIDYQYRFDPLVEAWAHCMMPYHVPLVGREFKQS
jgi:hypothetical protein